MGMTLNMDYSGVEPSDGGGSYFPISDSKGWLVVITDSDGKETKAKDGSTRLVMALLGQEGPVQGKTMEYGVNIVNKSQEAMRIGASECAAIARVTGHIKVGNSSEWHNKPFRVVVVDDSPDGSPVGTRTRIIGVRDVHGNKPSQAGQGAGQASGAFGGQQQGGFGGQPQGGGFGVQQGQQGGGFQQQQPQGQGQQGGGFNPQAQGQGFNPQTQGQGFQQQGPQGGGNVDPNASLHQPNNNNNNQPQGQGGFQQQGQGGGFNPAQQGGFNPQGGGNNGFQQQQSGGQPGWGAQQ